MSKGEGLKIGIKFTQDIVGDISGNELAFKVTGQEYKYINGPLIDGDYQIASVERYPILPVWEVDFTQGALIDAEDIDGLVLGVEQI